jgi:hypothetical protein
VEVVATIKVAATTQNRGTPVEVTTLKPIKCNTHLHNIKVVLTTLTKEEREVVFSKSMQ